MEPIKIRLNKALADAGICSRRRADELIFSGKVKINGTVVMNPAERVDVQTDSIECAGKKVSFSVNRKPCWLLLHKPIMVVSTAYDPEGRSTVMDFIPEEFRDRRLYPVGRLDFFSEGLLLLTDDGTLAHRLIHPRWEMPRVYHVLVRAEDGLDIRYCLEEMYYGMVLSEGDELAPVDVEILEKKAHREYTNYLLEITLIQGLNRQIRRMCRDLDLVILKLKRVQQGPIGLGDLPSGQVRELDDFETNALRQSVGLA